MTSSWRAAAGVFVAAVAVFLLSPVRQLSDSWYSLLASEQLVTRGTFDLAEHFSGELPVERFPGVRRDGLPYQVKRYGEKVLYEFPVGAPLLAAPWMAAAHSVGLGVADERGGYDRERERRHQRVLAALFSALFAVGAFVALEIVLDRKAALWTTVALVLATPLWSTASRGLWSHTAELALLGLALPIVAARARGSSAGGARLGLIAAGAYVCRPTALIVIALLGLWLCLQDRRSIWRYALGASGVLAGFALLSWLTWGALLPPYYLSTRLGLPSLPALAGALVSPGRGLFVYEPALLAALLFGATRLRSLAERPLFLLGAAGLALHALVVASFPHWWGGHGYGPRLFTETLFFQVLVAASVAATLARAVPPPRLARRTFGLLVALGVLIHGAGALSNQSNRWDWSPAEVDEHPERLWAWSDPQFLAWANRGPREEEWVEPAPEAQPETAPPPERRPGRRAGKPSRKHRGEG